MPSLPEAYLKEMQALLPEEDYRAYLDSFDTPRVYGLRVNTLKISPEDFLKISPFELKPIPWCKSGFYYKESDRPAKHPYYYAGLYYLQEPSAMLPAEVLPVEEGDRVLDTCAAPGGKSTRLLEKLKGTGLLFSNDISNSRALALLKNLELFGAQRLVLLTEDLKKLVNNGFEGWFDKILIDAPCSGEGMFRKEPSVIRAWEEHGHSFYTGLQKEITKNALKLLRPGGKMVYSTCTFSAEEDENIILHMKDLCPELKVLPAPDLYQDFSSGMPEKALQSDPELLNCIRVFPHKVSGEGHFVTLLQKGEGEREDNGKIITGLKSSGNASYRRSDRLSDETGWFLEDYLKKDFSGCHFEVRSGRVYAVPDSVPSLKGLRILRSGLLMGEEKKNRFEPSQALAMALKKEEFANIISFDAEDERVIRYLKGETVEIGDKACDKGWALICVGDFPLGFGKASAGSLKNKYLPGWRYMA